MTAALGTFWLAGAIVMLALVLLARRRRRMLAARLHELRGALTAARLAVDLMPLIGAEDPAVCFAASDELERSYHALGEFEDLLHRPVVPRPADGLRLAGRVALQRRMRGSLEPKAELERLALLWGAAARRCGRNLAFTWHGPQSGFVVRGRRREFAEAVANLLSNAIRHGAGEIELVASAGPGRLRVEVRDEGRGLPAPIGTIVRARRLGPHGHGLANAVRAAQRLGGSLSSAPSARGALLVLTLPARYVIDPLADADAPLPALALAGEEPAAAGTEGAQPEQPA